MTKIKVIAAGVALLGAFITGWKSAGWYRDSVQLDVVVATEAKEDKQQDDVDALALMTAERDAALAKAKKPFIKKVYIEREKPVYNNLECATPISGVQLYNRAAQRLTSATGDSTNNVQ